MRGAVGQQRVPRGCPVPSAPCCLSRARRSFGDRKLCIVRRPSRISCSRAGCGCAPVPGEPAALGDVGDTPPAVPAQVTSVAMPSAWGRSYGTKGGLAKRWEHRPLLLTLTQHHSSHLGLKAWCKGGTGIPWATHGDSQGGGDVTLTQANMHICSSFRYL